jgi:hypothetical protein
MSSVPAAVANIPLGPDTNWEDLLKQCPMMDPNSPDKPQGVREDSDSRLVIKISDFQPTLGRIYLHKPAPMPTNTSVLDSEIWYIYDTAKNLACRLRLLLLKATSSGFRFLYKYDETRDEAKRMKENDPIRSFTLPIRLWAGSSPTEAEAEQEAKLTLAASIVQFQFYRWRKAMGKHSSDLASLSILRGMEKTIRYKHNDKGEKEEGRGPTLTMRTYTQGVNGIKAVGPDFVLPYNQVECTTKVFTIQNRSRVRLDQNGIHELMPQWVARDLASGARPPQEGDPTKFLFDCEAIVHFAKARWAAKGGSISRFVTQVMVNNLREAGEADYDGFAPIDDDDDGEGGGGGGGSFGAVKPRAGAGASLSWASLGAKDDDDDAEVAGATKAVAGLSVKPGVVAKPGVVGSGSGSVVSPPSVSSSTAPKEETEGGDDEDEEDEEEEGEDDEPAAPVAVVAPAPAPAPATKPGVVASVAAASGDSIKSRRAPKKA